MPKLPRVSGKDTIKALERLGFVQIRQQGSHVVLKKEMSGGAVGKLRGLLRQAGVTPDEFMEKL